MNLPLVLLLSIVSILSIASTEAYADSETNPMNITIRVVQEDHDEPIIHQFASSTTTHETSSGGDLTANFSVTQQTLIGKVPHKVSEYNPVQSWTDWSGYVPMTYFAVRGVAPDGSEARWDIEKEQWTSQIILENEAKEAHAEIVAEQLQAAKPYWETVADRLPDDPQTTADQILIDKINQLLSTPDSACIQGIGTTSGVQHKRSVTMPIVEVPVYVTDVNGDLKKTSQTQWVLDETMPLNNVDLRGFLGEIYTDMRECAAQMVLNDPQGGILSSVNTIRGNCDENEGRYTVEQSISARCGMSSGAYYKDLKDSIPIWSQDRVNSEANFGDDNVSLNENPMCDSYNSPSTKRMYGCDLDIQYDPSTKPNPNTIGPNGGGMTAPELAFEQWKMDNGTSQKKTIIEKIKSDEHKRFK